MQRRQRHEFSQAWGNLSVRCGAWIGSTRGGAPPPVGRRPCPGKRRDGRSAPCSSSAMSFQLAIPRSGCSPAEPVSASPTGDHSAMNTSSRSTQIQWAATSGLTGCLSPGVHRMSWRGRKARLCHFVRRSVDIRRLLATGHSLAEDGLRQKSLRPFCGRERDAASGTARTLSCRSTRGTPAAKDPHYAARRKWRTRLRSSTAVNGFGRTASGFFMAILCAAMLSVDSDM
jgi:hypothetical protein